MYVPLYLHHEFVFCSPSGSLFHPPMPQLKRTENVSKLRGPPRHRRRLEKRKHRLPNFVNVRVALLLSIIMASCRRKHAPHHCQLH